MAPWARTSTKSRTRRRSRLAIRGVPRARDGDVAGPFELHVHAEDPRRAHHDPLQVLGRVEVEAARRSRTGRAAGS